MASLSHPFIHPFVGIGITTLAAPATQKVDWHPQGMLNAANVAAGFSFAQMGTHLIMKKAPPLQELVRLGASAITSDKNAQGKRVSRKTLESKISQVEKNAYRLEKVARAVIGFVYALGLSKLLNRSRATPISMKAAAAFCIIPTLLLLNESQPKP